MISVLDLAQEDTTLKKKSYKEFCGSCPGCHNTDGFNVKYNAAREIWEFMCRGCYNATDPNPRPGKDGKRGWGDDYAYLAHFRKMRHDDILAYRAAHNDNDNDQAIARPAPTVSRAADYTSAAWQEVIAATVAEYEAALWLPGGQDALAYLVETRGLTEETIRAAHIGVSHRRGQGCITIPSFNQGRHVAVYLRSLAPDVAPGERWQVARGSTNSELYLADCLKVKRPTVLVESSIDALSIVQECAGMCNVVATGGTGCAQNDAALAALALMPVVFVAFDAERTKGDQAAMWWLDRLQNARRLRPILKDVNDMLVENWDVRAWIGQAIARAMAEQEATRAAKNPYIDKVLAAYPDMLPADFLALPEEIQQELAAGVGVNYCEICLEPGPYEHAGQHYCEEHEPGRAALVKFNALVVDAVPGLVVQGIHKAADWPTVRAALITEKYEAYRQEEYAQRERVRLTIADVERRKKERAAIKQEVLV